MEFHNFKFLISIKFSVIQFLNIDNLTFNRCYKTIEKRQNSKVPPALLLRARLRTNTAELQPAGRTQNYK